MMKEEAWMAHKQTTANTCEMCAGVDNVESCHGGQPLVLLCAAASARTYDIVPDPSTGYHQRLNRGPDKLAPPHPHKGGRNT